MVYKKIIDDMSAKGVLSKYVEAFISKDWSMVADDFIEEAFIGIDGRHTGNPDGWILSFPDLETYKTGTTLCS